MALVTFGAGITEIVGSIQGWTFQSTRAGFIVRGRPRQKKVATSKQTLEQAAFVSLIQQFQDLTGGDKLAWDSFANNNPKENIFGKTKILTGQNWFTTINSARLRLALGILTVPPAALLPEQITSFDLLVNGSKIEISDILPNNPTDTGIFIDTTFPVSTASKLQRSPFRKTDTVNSGPFGTIDLTSDWEAAHALTWPPGGSAECINIGVRLVPVRVSTGITGAGLVNLSGIDFATSGIGFMQIGTTFRVS